MVLKWFRRYLSLLLAMLLVASVSATVSGSDMEEIAFDHVPDTVIVRFKEDSPMAARQSVLAANDLTETGKIYGTEDLVVTSNGKSAAALMKALRNNPHVEFVEPDYIYSIDWTPNDPGLSQQWAIPNISLPAAWDKTRGSSSVIIAVLDTGVQANHPDLSGKVLSGYNFVSNNTNTNDVNGHGTHVAGIAAAVTNNGIGIAGACPNCRILPVKVLSDSGSGSLSGIASGIRYAADRGAHVINMSLGGSAGSTALRDAVNYAYNRGSLPVCAAGNSNTSSPTYPAYYTNCLAVAATTSSNTKASFSNFGSWVQTSAPGQSIYSTYSSSTYRTLSGTSMAAPYAAGVAGLLYSQGRSRSQVWTRLTSSTYTDPVNSSNIPRKINANKAVSN